MSNRLSQLWAVLKVLRDCPDGVESVYLFEHYPYLYHHFSQRCGDLRRLYGYQISKAEKVPGPESNFRWKLLDHSYVHPDEIKHLGQPVYYQDGQGVFAGI